MLAGMQLKLRLVLSALVLVLLGFLWAVRPDPDKVARGRITPLLADFTKTFGEELALFGAARKKAGYSPHRAIPKNLGEKTALRRLRASLQTSPIRN